MQSKLVTPIEVPKHQVFKSYKDKVVFILQTYLDAMEVEEPPAAISELRWCIHVIKNDFLQISNSFLNTNPIFGGPAGAKGARRFSKT